MGTSTHYGVFCQCEMLTRFESHWAPVGAAETKIFSPSTPRRGKQNKRFSNDRKKKVTKYVSFIPLIFLWTLPKPKNKAIAGTSLKWPEAVEMFQEEFPPKMKSQHLKKSPQSASEQFQLRQNSDLPYSWCWRPRLLSDWHQNQEWQALSQRLFPH